MGAAPFPFIIESVSAHPGHQLIPPQPRSVDEAVLRTLLYADIFDYPLKPAEIHHYLMEYSAAPEIVLAALETSPWLAERITRVNGYVALKDRATLGPIRDERQRRSAALWPYARRWAYMVGCLPFVRMVGLTGALAVNNSPPDDDIDLLIVTAPGRVWLARALAVGLVYLARWLDGVVLCPNYVLAQTALAQDKRDLFTAHDLAQMVPLVGLAVYAQLRVANPWLARYLPHAQQPLHQEPDLAPRSLGRLLQRAGEWLLSGKLGDALEAWERTRKLRKFAPAAQRPDSAAQLDADHVKGHFDDHGHPILKKFHERLNHWSTDETERTDKALHHSLSVTSVQSVD
jgi:hypothetical protein